ncbi:LacI family DNA-binding transcriptional regulator, partial [Streptomyces sp. NPDC055078]
HRTRVEPPMTARAPSIVDVARTAGVSVATVSRVLNRPEMVSDATRQRVENAMAQLDYHVNRAASGLRGGYFRTVSIIVGSLSQPWYAMLVRALRAELQRRGYATLLYDLNHDMGSLADTLGSLARQGSEGIVLSTGDRLDDPATVAALRRARDRFPMVVVGQPIEDATWPTVQYDDRGGAYEATGHLLGIGADPVAFLGALPGSYLGDERFAGYAAALAERGLDPAEWCWPLDGTSYSSGHSAVTAHLEAGRVPGGILAVNDEVSLGASRALADAGLRVPDDVAVIGFGDTDLLPYVSPSLSSVHGPVEEIATITCSAIWDMFSGGKPTGVEVVGRSLITRESSARPTHQQRRAH